MKIKVAVEMELEVVPQQTRISVQLRKTELEGIGIAAVELAVKSSIALNRLLDHPNEDIATVKVKKIDFFVR